MYSIQVNYHSGDSFGSYKHEKILEELNTSDIKIAEENLLRIKEHYEAYLDLERRYSPKTKSVDEYRLCRWFCDSEYYKDSISPTIKLKADNGVEFNYYVDWVGYFEGLDSCEIINIPLTKYEF